MKILLHVCCGPCALYPLKALETKEMDVVCYFYNPNIHPFREFERRVEALEVVADLRGVDIIWDEEGYGFEKWLALVGKDLSTKKRCLACYRMRLEKTAEKARELNIPVISTTLLYSRYQQHDAIRDIGKECAKAHDLDFYYEDFRKGWDEGIKMSRELSIYRQPYCGCIMSEAERYAKRAQRLKSRLLTKQQRSREEDCL